MSPFTSAADTAILATPLQAGIRVYARTGFAGSSAFEQLRVGRWDFRASSGVLNLSLINAGLAFNDERSQTNRIQLLADILVIAFLGSETQGLFLGRIEDLDFAGFSASLSARDRRAWLEDCEAFVRAEPDAVEVVNDSTKRELRITNNGVHGQVYGFWPNGSGTDPAFDEASQLVRRSFVQASPRLFRSSGETDEPNDGTYWEVPSRMWQANWTSGTFSVFEDTTGRTYFASGVRCYKESAATGAADCDFAVPISAALEYALASGGIGATAGELDIASTGLDIAGPLTWPPTDRDAATTAQFIEQLLPKVAANLRLVYDPTPIAFNTTTLSLTATGKFKLHSASQKKAGEEDLTLNRGQLSFKRSASGLYSKVVVTGEVERPVNILANPDDYGLSPSFTDLSGGADWAYFDGVGAHGDIGFADAVKRAWDGDQQKGFIVHNISGASVDEWHQAFKIDYGVAGKHEYLRWVFPGSKCLNALVPRAHAGVFWPGVHIEASLDNTNWYPVSPVFDHARRAPGSRLEAKGSEITMPFYRYLRFTLGTYKFGTDNYDDPGMGCAEFDDVADFFFRIEREAQNSDADAVFLYTNNSAFPIIDADTGADTLTIAGDHLDEFAEGDSIVVEGSTGNDGTGVLDNVELVSGDTVLHLVGAVASAVADGSLRLAVSSYQPDLLTRLGGRQKTFHRDVSGEFNEHLAQDVATQEFAERVRLFEKLQWRGPFDPRVQMWQTVAATCRVSGVSASFLVEDFEHGADPASVDANGRPKPGRRWTKVYGTDYRARGLDNG